MLSDFAIILKKKIHLEEENKAGCFAFIVSQMSSKKIGYNIHVLQQTHAWWSTQSRLATLLSSLIARQWVGLQTL